MLEALTPTMEGHAVTVTDNHRHLGVVLSEDLKWSKHAQSISAAAPKRAGLLRLMARDLPLPVASILYVYYVCPVLDYASPVWHGSLREEDAMSSDRIQASVARSLLQADWFTQKEDLFRQPGWPALTWRREITSLMMFHKLLHSRLEPLTECLFQVARKCHLSSQPPQAIPTAPPTNTHQTLQRIFFSIDRLFYGTHSRTTYNQSRIVNHFAMLSRNTTNHVNLPQQKTFTYHSPLPFISLQIVCTLIPDCVTSHAPTFLQPLDGDPLDQGSSLLGNP